MTLQEQLRKLTSGGPGVTHIASETLFDDAADHIDALERIIESWKREEAEWTAEREELRKDAERYRWLRSEDTNTNPRYYAFWQDANTKLCREQKMDAAVDAAMAAGEKP